MRSSLIVQVTCFLTKVDKALYYILITLLNKIGIDIILFQKILLSFSIVTIVFFIGRNTSVLLSILSYLLIIFNTYYISYAKTILPESVIFSLLNLAVVFLFEEKRGGLIIFALICGIMASLKPVGIFLSVILLIIYLIKNKKTHKVLIFITFFTIPIIVENSFFYSHFKERSTVFKQSVIGKLVVLSGMDSFIINDYSEELWPLLEKTKKEYRIVHKFLNSLDSILLKAELLSDYEVIAQYQTFNLESIKNLNLIKNYIGEEYKQHFFTKLLKIIFMIILNYPYFHYLGNWSIGSKVEVFK